MTKRAYPPNPTVYGSTLLKTRAGRARPRPIATRQSMHFVLRSTQATGPRSFRAGKNLARTERILKKFADRHHVHVVRHAVSVNHIHLQLRTPSRLAYVRFIRAVTAALALALGKGLKKFWDRRPFSRVILGARDERNIRRYLRINVLEALMGYSRIAARFYAAVEATPPGPGRQTRIR